MSTEAGIRSQPMVIIAALVAVVVIHTYFRHYEPPHDVIDYQGDFFVLQRYYPDYDAFKDDPANYTPEQLQRIEELLTQAAAPASFQRFEELAAFTSELQVPGYGSASSNASTSQGVVFFSSIEIPQAKKDRVLIYLHRPEKNAYVLLDDFIADEQFGMPEIEIKQGQVRYLDHASGKLLRQVPLIAL